MYERYFCLNFNIFPVGGLAIGEKCVFYVLKLHGVIKDNNARCTYNLPIFDFDNNKRI